MVSAKCKSDGDKIVQLFKSFLMYFLIFFMIYRSKKFIVADAALKKNGWHLVSASSCQIGSPLCMAYNKNLQLQSFICVKIIIKVTNMRGFCIQGRFSCSEI